MATYEIKRPTESSWQDAGETVEGAEAAMVAKRDRAQSTTLVFLRNNFNGSVTVFEVDALGNIGNRGSYGAFYGTDNLPA